MEIRNFWVGKIDGKDAFNDAPDNQENFKAFVVPETVSLEKLLSRKSQFVLGLRGTGKTSILRYIAYKYKDRGTFDYVLFKTDITEQKRVEISKNVWYSEVSSEKFSISQDFKESWKWFIYYKIATILSLRGDIPSDSKILDILGINNKWFKSVLGYFPKMVSGAVKIETDQVPFLKGDATLEFSNDGKNVTIESLNRKIESEIKNIKLSSNVYIVFDELEVFYDTDEQYARDVKLVRDLLFSIKFVNDLLRNCGVHVFLIAGVRSEVLYALGSGGQEIERLVEDNAEKLVWHLGKRSYHHPLMDVLRAYLRVNDPDYVGDDILFEYFPRMINRSPVDTFILDNYFYKPRDIVARLTAAKDTFPSSSKFSQSVLEQSQHEYGRLLLREVRYELSAGYSPAELDLIESLFRSKKPYFSRFDFTHRLDEFAEFGGAAQSLKAKRGGDTMLRDLYRTGMIGNEWTERGVGRTNRWIFRGEERLVLERQMVVNRALWEVLAIRRSPVKTS